MSGSVVLLLVVGLALLFAGAEMLVRGASRLALGLGVSPLVVGLTVVAFGTSTPELAVSVGAALGGEGGADIAVGNVVGSNTANVLLILGLSAVVAPLVVSRQLVRLDVPIMVGCSVLLLALAADGAVGRWEGLLLVAGIVTYTGFAIVQSRREAATARAEAGGPRPRLRGRELVVSGVLIVAGLGGLILGARWLVAGAVTLAETLGISELVIGLTVVAVGTSLPELATSVLAAFRGERDIAVGNVVGSNIFNILCVLGASAVVGSGELAVSSQARSFDLPVMLAVAVLCVPIFFTGYRISRLEGASFLALYGLYVAVLALHANQAPALDTLKSWVLWGVAPLTVAALAVASFRQWRGGTAGPGDGADSA